MPGDKETLLGMGFESARIDWALRATNNRGLQPAMDHILEHQDQPVPEAGSEPAPSGEAGQPMDEDDEDAEAARIAVSGAGQDLEAKSIKCSQCGKVFRNTALAEFHAEKSGHDQFEESTEEIKPLTEEEKKQKLEELRAKMAEKRARKAEEDAKEARANEAIRRKTTKDMNVIKEELKAKQAIKDAEKKRQEKIDDAKAKAAVKAQIEADKRERAEKAAREKALREGRSVDAVPESAAPAPKSAATSGVAGKDYKETRLQIRLASGGQPLVTTLPSEATLAEVAQFVGTQVPNIVADNITFTQQFPRKTFSPTDFSRSLRDLGLTPSAVLIAS